MRAITLDQPYASLTLLAPTAVVARTSSTHYRGPLAIHASARLPDVEMLEDGLAGELYDEDNEHLAQWYEADARDYAPDRVPPRGERWSLWTPEADIQPMPLGAVVGIGDLVDVAPMVARPPAVQPPGVILDVGARRFSRSGERVPGWCDAAIARRNQALAGQWTYWRFEAGHYAWIVENARAVSPPLAAKGHRGLWECADV